jgi:hypothetical protein
MTVAVEDTAPVYHKADGVIIGAPGLLLGIVGLVDEIETDQIAGSVKIQFAYVFKLHFKSSLHGYGMALFYHINVNISIPLVNSGISCYNGLTITCLPPANER